MGRNSNCIVVAVLALLFAPLIKGGSVKLQHLSTVYLPATFTARTPVYRFQYDAVQDAVYEPSGKLIYAIGDTMLHIIKANNPLNLTYLDHVIEAQLNLLHVTVCWGAVFVTYGARDTATQGGILQYSLYNRTTSSISFIRDIKVGTEPASLRATKTCTLVVSLENSGAEIPENSERFQDPPGGVAIIRFPQGVLSPPVITTLNFTAFDSRFPDLGRTGVRWIYRGNNNRFSDDLEPDCVTFNFAQTKAFISLQENNAIAVVDMLGNNITDIYGLGFKKWSESSLDPSDKDGGIRMAPWPIYGMYQPDRIQYFRWEGVEYIVTANEGSDKGYDAVNFKDDIRGNDLLDSEIAPSLSAQMRAALRNDTELGRLQFSRQDGRNAAGKLVTLHTFGARSFSIWRASDMTQVYDSGSLLGQKVKELRPDLFNNHIKDESDLVASGKDKRSDEKGVEPESVAVVELKDKLVLFVGLERPGIIAVFSLTRGQGIKPRFQSLYSGGIPRGNRTWGQLFAARKLHAVDPDCLSVIGVDHGLASYPILMATGSDSGTVSLLKIDISGAYSPVQGSHAGVMLFCLLLLLSLS